MLICMRNSCNNLVVINVYYSVTLLNVKLCTGYRVNVSSQVYKGNAVKRVKSGRITVYAQSGRVSIKTLIKIIDEHIKDQNYVFAKKALHELETEVHQLHQSYLIQISKFKNRIEHELQ